jgi:hypothetical protein
MLDIQRGQLRIQRGQFWTNVALAVIAVPALIMATWQTIATVQQYYAMIDSNKIVAESGEREQRAYINVVTNDRPKLQLLDGRTFSFDVKIKNVGKTPALNLVTSMGLFHLPASNRLGPEMNSLERLSGMMVLGPDQDLTLNSQLPLDQHERGKQANKESVAWFACQVEYDDVFGDPHFTTFIFQQVPNLVKGDDKHRFFDMRIVETKTDHRPKKTPRGI